MSPEILALSAGSRSRRRIGDDDDVDCPRLFIVLPVNRDGLTVDDGVRIVTSTLLFDGCAVHLLCEFPDGYHVTSAPGYRLRRPGEFVERYGGHVTLVLGLLARLAASSAVSLEYAVRTRAVCRLANTLMSDLVTRYPAVKRSHAVAAAAHTTADDQLHQSAAALPRRRADLRRRLRLADEHADTFGPLHRLRYDRISDDSADGGTAHALWLCADHFRLMSGDVAPAKNSNKNFVDAFMY